MTEGVVVRWLHRPGDRVSPGEPIAEIETDKATVDLEAPEGGRLGRHRVAEGDVIPVGTLLVVLLGEGESEGEEGLEG
jgi:pyruvate/2-oxoglutarate dehydrogenase complex dihydrolipoamide acyltransferase (E2) component